MVDLSPLHHEAAQAATSGGRFAAYVRGLCSRIQNECNNMDFGAIREIAVQAAAAADDVALSIELGWEEAEARRGVVTEAAGVSAAEAERVVALGATGTTERSPEPHAGPTDTREAAVRAPVDDDTVRARGTGRAGTVSNTGTVGRR